jgi:DNA-binding protein YbaB
MGWQGYAPVAPAQPLSDEHELTVLKEQARQMQANMEMIQGRIQQLETPPQKDA